ncbi:MAG: MarC family NAAT transporter [Gammaproteobacteria bacterium]|nr:MarC family NAAT transporter [Gammaproteobacteria bacterium]
MEFLKDWLGLYASGVVTLFAMMNPVAAVPVFLALTAGHPPAEQAAIAWRAGRNSAVVLLVCLVTGALAMEFFSISLAALRVAGGLIIAFLGFRLLFAYADAPSAEPQSPHSDRLDPSLVPLAIPTLSGPGSMSVVITSSTTIPATGIVPSRMNGYLVEAAAVITVAIAAWLILRASPRLLRLLGQDGIASLKGVMGFLLVCIGVQFVANGVADFVGDYRG